MRESAIALFTDPHGMSGMLLGASVVGVSSISALSPPIKCEPKINIRPCMTSLRIFGVVSSVSVNRYGSPLRLGGSGAGLVYDVVAPILIISPIAGSRVGIHFPRSLMNR